MERNKFIAGIIVVLLTLQIAMAQTNVAPELAIVGDQFVQVGKILTITLVASDMNDDALYFSMEGLPEGANLKENGDNTATFSWKPKESQLGTYKLGVYVSDKKGGKDTEIITITVQSTEVKNNPPQLGAIGNQSVKAGEKLKVVVKARDANNDALTLGLIGKPEGATFESTGENAATFIWTPKYSHLGSHRLFFKVIDNKGGEDTETVIISVTSTNNPPVLDTIGDKTTKEQERLRFMVTATDKDNDALKYTATNLPTGAIFQESGAGGWYWFSWTPDGTQAGTYKVTFTADDQKGGIDTETITITVTETSTTPTTANYPPELSSISNKNIKENEKLEFTVTATDKNNDVLEYTATGLPTGATLESTTGKFSWTPTYTQAGTYSLTFKADDKKGGTDTETITITVTDVNQFPGLSSIGDKQAKEGEKLEFNISAVDADNDVLEYTATGLPTGATLGSTTGKFSWTPTSTQAGTYSVTFKADDKKGGTDTEIITITVTDVSTPNNLPELSSIGNKSIKENEKLEFTVTATDKDNDVLEYTATGLPTGATLGSTTGKFSWTPTSTQSGTYSVTFKADDKKGGTDTETVTFTVTDLNQNEEDVKKLEDKYDDYEDEYEELEDDYYDAKKKGNSKEITKIEDKLENLEEDLDELKDDVDDLQKTVTDSQLDDRLDDLEKDIKKLKNKVKDLLDKISGKTTSSSSYSSSSVQSTPSTKSSTQKTADEVTVSNVPLTTASTPATSNNWQKVRLYAWLAAGAVALLAMVIFLIKLILLKR